MTTDKLLERIQKLMALADPTKNDNRAQVEVAAEKVAELLTKNNLTPKDVTKHEIKSQLIEGRSEWFLKDDGAMVEGFNEWFTHLARDVGYANYCRVLYTPRSATFIGKERDVEIAKFMFNNLAFRLIELSKVEVKKYEREYYEAHGDTAYKAYGRHHPKVWRRTWLQGAVDGLSDKLTAPRREKEIAQRKTDQRDALIVVDAALQEFIDELYPNLRKKRGFTPNSANGGYDTYNSGRDAGRGLSLQQGVNKGASRKELRSGE